MTHHGHLVQRWLTIEKDVVTIDQVSFNDPSVFEIDSGIRSPVFQIYTLLGILDNEFRTRVGGRSVIYNFLEFSNVVRCDPLRIGQVHGNRSRDTDLI